MKSQWPIQLLAVIRLEIRKTFLARRGLWVYLLALAPAMLLFGHSIQVPIERQRMAKLAVNHPIATADLRSIKRGMNAGQVFQRLGEPFARRSFIRRLGERLSVERTYYRYTDGISEYRFSFDNGILVGIQHQEPQTLNDTNLIFSALFQYFDLRLAIFFGCVGIFTNLFRGEMSDKSLHYYLLTPMRREWLVAGKFLAGLIAAVTIFTASTALQVAAMLMQFKRQDVFAYFSGGGWEHLAAYVGVTALACIGYGSVFLATGLFFRNPIVPAAVVLLWESINVFLPVGLKKISLTYYLESLCPVVPPQDSSIPMMLRLMISNTTAASKTTAISGILILTTLLLVASAWRARKLEINYGSE